MRNGNHKNRSRSLLDIASIDANTAMNQVQLPGIGTAENATRLCKDLIANGIARINNKIKITRRMAYGRRD